MVYTLLPVFSIGCILCFVNDLLDNLLLLMPSASNNRFTKLFSSVTHVPFLRGSAQAHIDLFLFGFILYAPRICMHECSWNYIEAFPKAIQFRVSNRHLICFSWTSTYASSTCACSHAIAQRHG